MERLERRFLTGVTQTPKYSIYFLILAFEFRCCPVRIRLGLLSDFWFTIYHKGSV
jgi:hypothetical protein